MPLSHKHYQSIAAIFKAHSRRALNDAGDNGGADIWLSIRDDIADYLANDNPNFDRGRFRRATEPDGRGEPDAPGEAAKLETAPNELNSDEKIRAFALRTLQILENDEDWGGDTFDGITSVASELKLVKDKNPWFQRVDWVKHRPIPQTD